MGLINTAVANPNAQKPSPIRSYENPRIPDYSASVPTELFERRI